MVQRLFHRRLERAVVIAVDQGVLEHLPVFDPALKILLLQEVIIDPVELARPRWPCRARDRVDEVRRRAQVLAKGGLAGARRRRDDEEDALASKDRWVHSLF